MIKSLKDSLELRQFMKRRDKLQQELRKIDEREGQAKYDYESTVLWAQHARARAKRKFSDLEIQKESESTPAAGQQYVAGVTRMKKEPI
jgi:hypothetical protein